jgi:phosphoenolpyruvate carboxylase
MIKNIEDNNDIHLILNDEDLRSRVKLLGRLLGDIISEQEGDETLALIEKLRAGFIEERKSPDPGRHELLLDTLKDLPIGMLTKVIRAFSNYFHLANIAEESFQVSTRELQRRTQSSLWSGSFRHTLNEFRNTGLSHQQLADIIKNLHYQPVFTAHPTESKRQTILESLRRIFTTCKEYYDPSIDDDLRPELLDRLKALVQIFWKTDDVRSVKPTVQWEIETAMYYYRETIFAVIPDLYRNLERAILKVYPADENNPRIQVPSFITFGSWVGGDRDGNNFVTNDVTREACLLQHKEIINEYLRRVDALGKILTHSASLCAISPELLASLDEEKTEAIAAYKNNELVYINEPYRRKLGIMKYRLQCNLNDVNRRLSGNYALVSLHAYKNESALLSDLYLIRDSLIHHNDYIISTGSLKDLIRLIETFGFFLAKLDIRQESSVHTKTLAEILNKAGIEDNYSGLNEEDKLKLISDILDKKELITVDEKRLTKTSLETWKSFVLIRELREVISPEIIGEYVISMTHTTSNILEVMLLGHLARLSGKDLDGNLYCHLSITPLFETIEDLHHCEEILEKLFNVDAYVTSLGCRKNTQEIMLGYSDSCKDGGILASSWNLYKAQENILRITDKYNINCRFFHGRGGSVGRGGGAPIHEAMLAQPPGSVRGDIKFTEQGEVLSFKYNYAETAVYELTQGITGLLRASEHNSHSEHKDIDEFKQIMGDLTQSGEESFRELTDRDPGLMQYFYESTPANEISLLNIGSRPSHRKLDPSKASIRAIPWVFGWAQARQTLPGWYGLGSALKETISSDNKLKIMQGMYRDWPFFRTLINNSEMGLAKSEQTIARDYSTLCKDEVIRNRIFDRINQEYLTSCEMIMKITGYEEMLEEEPELALSLKRRNPYLDPINYIQVILLQRYRENDDDENKWLDPLLRSINAISNGVRNTG